MRLNLCLLLFLFILLPLTVRSEDAQQTGAPPPMPVVVEDVNPKVVQIWKEFSGRILAVDYVQIRPQVSGPITEVRFEDGAHVNKGDVLFVIDKRPYEAAFRGAQAALDTAKNQLILADKEMIRAKGLIKTNAISKRIYDERVSARNVAAAQVEAASASLEQAQINLDYAEVKAPVSGYTSRAEVTEGNLVDPVTAQILTTIVSDAGVYADFDVDEKTYLQDIRNSSSEVVDLSRIGLQVSSPSLPDKVFKGKLHAIDNRIDPASGTIRVRAYLPNTDKVLVPGMFVNVKIAGAAENKTILLSEKAIGTDQDRKYVLVVEHGKATYRPVTLGASSEGKREILTGLAAGDKVIVEGLMHIRLDMPVSPMTAEQMAAMAAGAQAAVPAAGDEAKPEAKP